MGDKLIFLGTGGDIYVVSKKWRTSGGIILKTDETQIHIDPGIGAIESSKRSEINLRENTAVIITHQHLNHANDANAVAHAMTYGGEDKKGVLITNIPKENEGQENYLTPRSRSFFEKEILMYPGKRIGINEIEIKATETKHYESGAYGLIITTPNYKIGYTSDTGFNEEIANQYQGCDIIIANCKNPDEETISENNLTPQTTAEIANKSKTKILVITHLGNKLAKDDLAVAREIRQYVTCQTILAKDGLVMELQNYIPKRQK